MSQAFFPVLPGLSWSVHKRPVQSTRVAKHVSGRTVRVPLYAWPLWSFELTYQVLRADNFHRELQTLMGFFLARQGQYDTFLFDDPSDDQATAQVLGAGDGTTSEFTFLHPLSADQGAPVGQVEPDGINVYLDGILQPPTAYTVSLPNILTFDAAPAAGAAITADYSFLFRLRLRPGHPGLRGIHVAALAAPKLQVHECEALIGASGAGAAVRPLRLSSAVASAAAMAVS